MMPPKIGQQNFPALWQDIREQALCAVDRVGNSGWWILGNEVRGFEQALASWWGMPHAIGCANGTDAIEIALRAGGLAPGGRVLTTPLSAFATTLAIVRAGGVPVFCDVDDSGLMDLSLAEKALQQNPDIRYCVPVHLYGHAMDLEALAALRARHELCLVEDCAQAIGASSHGKAVGTAGDFAAVSFYPTKNLGAMGDAGALLAATQNGDEAARQIRDYGQTERFVHARPGLNSRLDELHAAILSVLLPKLPGFIRRRREIAACYLENIDPSKVAMLPVPPQAESAWHLFPVLPKGNRDAFRRHLEAEGIVTGVHYPHPIPPQPALAGMGAACLTPVANAERLCASVVSLPIHPYLTDEELQRVAEACNRWKG